MTISSATSAFINWTRIAVTAIVATAVTIQTYFFVALGHITASASEVAAFVTMALLVQMTIGWFVEKFQTSGLSASTSTPRELNPPKVE